MKCLIYRTKDVKASKLSDQKRPSPSVSGFKAQLLRASHLYRVVPREVLTFFRLVYPQLHKCVHNCENHSLVNSFICLVKKLTFEI